MGEKGEGWPFGKTKQSQNELKDWEKARCFQPSARSAKLVRGRKE